MEDEAQGQSSSGNEDPSPPTRPTVPHDAGMRLIGEIVKQAMSDAPPWAKLLLALPTVAAIIALLAGLASDDPYRFWLVFSSLVLFLVALILLVIIAGPFGRRQTPWKRDFPRLPIPEEDFRRLRAKLGDFRNAAIAWVNTNVPASKQPEIRVNVFLPDTQAAARGYVCELFIPAELRIGMDDHPDKEIRFLPGQGLTGTVFSKSNWLKIHTPQGAREGREGEKSYPLTDEQIRQIHSELCWIISFPLPFRGRPAGAVLNVDGLRHELTEQELDGLFGELSVRAADFADELEKLSKTRVTVSLEEIDHA